MQTIKLNVSGMKCGHCVQNVTNALNALEGVTATVSLEDGTATVEASKTIDNNTLIKAVETAGYGAQVAE
jgi:copper chaperone CopZ